MVLSTFFRALLLLELLVLITLLDQDEVLLSRLPRVLRLLGVCI